MKANNAAHSVGATWRALLIGALLVPVNTYWVMDSLDQGYPTTVSLFYNVIFCLFILTGLNIGLARLSPSFALKQGELLTIYVMLSIASALTGHDMLRVLIPSLPFAHWHASAENEWVELFHRYIPDWAAVKDTSIMTDYYKGEASLYLRENIMGWMKPVLAWSGFLFALLFGMICINSLVRRQWTEHEKLSYPIIQLPLEMTRGGGTRGILRSRIFWLGFAAAGMVDILNGIHHLVPAFPSIGGRLYNLHPLFTGPPWNAIGWTPVALFPFAVGLAFFIPLDLSFSCWFFYLVWKVQRIAGVAIGVRSMPGFPFIDEQSYGAYVGLFVIAMIGTRRHFGQVLRKFFTNTSEVDDSREPMPYRATILGLLACGFVLTIFCKAAGMSVWVILLFFSLYYIVSTAITRMRAELGSPVHDLHYTGPDTMMPKFFGTRKLGPHNLTMFAYLFFFNRAYRGHPMPHQLEGFKLAERAQIDNRRLLLAMVIAIVLGTLSAFWAYLHICYTNGVESVHTWFPWQPFNRLQRWLATPSNPNYPASIATFTGLLTTLFLMFMRMRMFWWPFHPAGYAVSSSWSMNVLWFSIFFSCIVKWVVLRIGGLRAHRKAMPFFLGLVMGEFFVGGIWCLVGISMDRPMYRFLF